MDVLAEACFHVNSYTNGISQLLKMNNVLIKKLLFIAFVMSISSSIFASQSSTLDSQQAANQKSQFLRVSRADNNQPLSLDTVIARYQNKHNLTVDLVAAVHVADAAYYQKLNTIFESYDAVLYELVAPKGTRPKYSEKRSEKSTATHPISKLQQGMKKMLELSFQLSEINYTKPNFVHADLSPKQLSESMKKRGESFVKILFKMVLQSALMQKSTGISDSQLILALMSKDRALSLKKLLARQFESLGSSISMFEGSNGSTLITERNNQALKVLSSQINQKKLKIAIFYGAGHMPNFEKQLKEDFAMTLTDKTWLSAWDLTGKK